MVSIKTLRRSNSSYPVGPPAVLPRQDRKGREQRREHDHVAEDEDPESVSDDDALRRRPAAAAPARELGWNRGWSSIDCCDRHAGCLSLTEPVPSAQFRRPRFRAHARSFQPDNQDHGCGGEEAEDRHPPDVPDQRKAHDHRKESGNEAGRAVARHFDRFICQARPGPARCASCPRTRRSSRLWAAPRSCRPAAAKRSTTPGFDRSRGRRSGRGGSRACGC